MAEQATADKRATYSMILGVGSVTCACFTGIPAIILGLMAVSDASPAGRFRARVGIGVGALMTLVWLGVAAVRQPPAGDSSTTASSTRVSDPGPAATESAAAPRPEASSPKAGATANLGETFTLGKFSYVIRKAEMRRSVGNEFVKERAPSGATFLLLHYSIRNDGNQTETVLTDDLTLVDPKGRTFRPSSEAQTALMMSGGPNDFLLSELQPGIKKDTVTAFLIPEDALGPGLSIVVPEKGLLGTRKVQVALIQ